VLGEPGLKGLEPPAGATDPVGERRTVQLDALPGEDLALSIKREMVAIFGDQHVSQESRGRKALGDRPLRGRGLMNGPASPAAIARPADSDDPQPCRYVIEHLADSLADQVQGATAAGACLVIKIEASILSWQVRRQTWSFVLPRRPSGLGQWKPGFGPCQISVEVFQGELQLIAIKLLGPSAKLVTLKLLDDEVEAFDLGLRLVEAGALGDEGVHHPLQRLHIVGQHGEIDVHECGA
jgi:hypothetical protein